MLSWLILLALIGASMIALYLGKAYFQGAKCTITKRLDGKIVFITGSNTGIGKITAIELAKRGATVLIACRDQRKGQDVAKEIQDLGLQRPTVMTLDLTDLKSVDECVQTLYKSKIDHIDILINNAGIMATQKRDLTKQGFESQLGVNHIGHFYLTNQLIPFLQKAYQSRVVNVSALAHKIGEINYNDINYDNVANSFKWKAYHTFKAYGASKLMNILHAKELKNRYETGNSGLFKAVSLHPGVINTELMRQQLQNPIFKLFYKLSYLLTQYVNKTPLQGAQTTLYCALEDYDKLKGGAYYSDCVELDTNTTTQDAEKLWLFTEDLIKKQYKP